MATSRACFVSASGQNAYFRELLDVLRQALEDAGVATERAVDHFPPAQAGLVYVFVPHEYLPFTDPGAHPAPQQLRRSVVLMTEQPGTGWFERSAAVAGEAGTAVEIHPSGLAELRRRGLTPRHMPLGYVPSWDRWQGADAWPRPTDYTFLGQVTARRERVLARGAPFLHRWEGSIHLAGTHAPHTGPSAGFLTGERKWDHLSRTRALLNVHRDDLPYFEWLRMVEAISNGCVVVSEHSLGYEPLVPGEHFLSATPDRLPLVLDTLLADQPRLDEMRRAAYALIREELPLARSAAVLAGAVEDVARAAATGAVARAGPDRSVPLPTRLPERKPRYAEVNEAHDEGNDAAMMRLALKQLVLGQRDLQRRLRDIETGTIPPEATTYTRGPYATLSPSVTVATTLYNYEGYIGDALASVALSDRRDVEVVVVDDASTDNSLAAVDATLDAHPWLSAKIVALGRNVGLAAARNTAFEHARGEYVFVLDADNVVYPKALDRLAEALDSDPEAAFAYGMLELFDAKGGTGLFSWPAWSPYELRFGNYIDAMTTIRRSAWRSVGGFSEDPRLYGWEDFALWCEFAQRGLAGVRVPDILCRYRKGRHSMLSVTDIDHAELWALLVERYPVLTARAQDLDEPVAG